MFLRRVHASLISGYTIYISNNLHFQLSFLKASPSSLLKFCVMQWYTLTYKCRLETIHSRAKIRNTNYTAIPQLQNQQFTREVWGSCPRTQMFILPSSLSAENMSAFVAHQKAISLASWQNIKQRQKPTYRSLEGLLKLNRGIKSFSFLCWMLCIMGQKVSTKSLMAALSDCFPSSSCLLYAHIGNNTNIDIKETKKWLPFKTWCSLSVPSCTALPQRKLKLLMLVYRYSDMQIMTTKTTALL